MGREKTARELPGAPPAVRELLSPRPLEEIRPGLSRTRAMLQSLGDPHRSCRTLQVAGTNGKGSVTSCAAAVLSAAHGGGGTPVGAYLSPHVVDFGERIQLDGRPASGALLEACARRVSPEADRAGATHFEALTVLALLAFAEADAAWAVVEVGMGGRLDATTVLSPEACAVCPIATDHEAHLGRGLRSIAREKAGVIRRAVPAAIAAQPPVPAAVVEERAREVSAPLLWLGRDASVTVSGGDVAGTRFRYRSAGREEPVELTVGLPGPHGAENAGLALLLLEAAGVDWTAGEARRGLSGIRLPGRLQVAQTDRGLWVLDLAHNLAAVEALLEGLRTLDLPRPWVTVCSVLGDKEWTKILERLGAATDVLVCTHAPSAPPGRRWNLETVRTRPPGRAVRVEPELERAVERAAELAGAGTVVVTGSSYLVGDVIRGHPDLGRSP